uniref:Uncharacterized protein n=1 Tax=Oryza punctata TaxID=4537 RepID=A0A0E0KAX4_ORYPU
MSSTACHRTCSRRSTTRSSEDRSPRLSRSQRRGPRSATRRRRRGRRRRRKPCSLRRERTAASRARRGRACAADGEARRVEVQLLPPFRDEAAPRRRRRPLRLHQRRPQGYSR